MEYIEQEPVRFWAAVTALVAAGIAVAQLFGWIDWTSDQIAGIMGLVAAFGGLFMFFFVRDRVTPVANPRSDIGEKLVPERGDG